MEGGTVPYGANLPDGWGTSPLKYLASLTNGYVFNSQDWKEHGTPIIRIENLNGSRDFNYSDSELGANYRITKGDLLFSWSGNPGTSFGPFRWTLPGDFYLNQHIFKMGVFGCDKDWLFWALKAATHWIERKLTSGMIGMVHVTKEDLKNVPIPIPPLEEQRRIADFLDAETARIDRLAKLRATQVESTGARMLNSVSRTADDLGGRHGTVKVRHVLQKIEQGWSPQCEDRRTTEGEWGVVKAGCVNGGIFDEDQHKALPTAVSPELRYRLRAGDLLMSRASGSVDLIGSVGVLPKGLPSNLLLCDKIYRLHMDRTRMDHDFVALMLRTHRVREEIKLGISGADGMANNLPTATVTNLPLPDVPLAQQGRIVEEFRSQQRATQETQQLLKGQLSILSERRQALVTAAVTGQFDVTTAGRAIPSGGTA